MGGDSADPMIADAYAFGARDFNVQDALTYMLKGADDTTSALGQGVYAPRLTNYIDQSAWNDYLSEGYVQSGADSSTFGTSLTQEFALDDFSIGQFAAAIGKPRVEATFAQRGQNWQNVFDPDSGYVQPRGTLAPGDPATQQDGFEEGDAAQYTWMVPQNLSGLFTALGGDSAAVSRLNSFFTQLNAGNDAPYDWVGNEVTMVAPWAYDYAGQPWRTQDVVRQIITQLYAPTPGGEPGNDDLGAMSSWYVWAALGMFPETPGTSTLALGSPLFPRAVVHMGNGRTLTINAPQAAAGTPYVQSLTLNGSAWQKNYLSAAQYANGATLDYDLGTTPDTTRGTAPQDAPPSYTQGEAAAIGFTSQQDGFAAGTGQSASVSVGARNEVQRPLKVAWTATAPAGITVTPSSGVLTVPAGGQATVPATISVVGQLSPGTYDVHIGFTGTRGDRVTSADVPVAVPTSLSSSFDNTAISDDSAPSAANIINGRSYSAQALAAQGITPGSTVSYDGTSFTWPDVPAGTPDNVEADGQLIAVSGSGTSLAFLGSATGNSITATGTVFYTDGTSQQFTLTLGNWWGATGDVVAKPTYQNDATGQYQQAAYVYYASVPIESGKQVLAVQLPVTGTSPAAGMHIFGVAVS
jgi:hypothetical protein